MENHNESSKPKVGKSKKTTALLIGKVSLVIFLAFCVYVTFLVAKIWFTEGPLAVNSINTENIVMVLIDEDGDANFDYQIIVESTTALRDKKTGDVFLSVTGSISNLEP